MTSVSSMKSQNSQKDRSSKRRPSLGGTEESQRQHEGHTLQREASGIFDKPGVPKPVVVQTQVELKLMEAVPAMYGAADASGLREELREDMQESIAKRCIAQPGDVRKILTEWLHDCPDASAREQLVAKVELEVKELNLKGDDRSKSKARGVSFGVTDAQEAPEQEEAEVPVAPQGTNRSEKRRGTAFEKVVLPTEEDEEEEEEAEGAEPAAESVEPTEAAGAPAGEAPE